jgi:hypothetical protein
MNAKRAHRLEDLHAELRFQIRQELVTPLFKTLAAVAQFLSLYGLFLGLLFAVRSGFLFLTGLLALNLWRPIRAPQRRAIPEND